MLKFEFVNELGHSVQAQVMIAAAGLQKRTATDSAGKLLVEGLPAGEEVMLTVEPEDGHWSCIFPRLTQSSRLICPRIGDPALTWWKNAPGGAVANTVEKRLRVGVVDQAFPKSLQRSGLHCVDLEGRPIEGRVRDHGYQVAELIETKAQECIKGDIVVVDVSDADDPSYWDFVSIGAAIELLVEEYEVDIINISGGDPPRHEGEICQAFDLVQQKISWANAKGTIVVAATGNSSSKPVSYPAKYAEVVGVGAVGVAGLGPMQSIARWAELIAQRTTEAFGSRQGQSTYYHVAHTSFGSGLNLVAPGVGVVHEFSDGRIFDLMGTSFASPLATAAIIENVSRRPHLFDESGRVNVDKVLQSLGSWSIDLGISGQRQGYGMLTVT